LAGVKGRSGRRPLSIEQKRLKIIDKAWEIVEQTLNDPNVSVLMRRQLAKDIVLKDLGRHLEAKGEGFDKETKIIIVRAGNKSNESEKDVSELRGRELR